MLDFGAEPEPFSDTELENHVAAAARLPYLPSLLHSDLETLLEWAHYHHARGNKESPESGILNAVIQLGIETHSQFTHVKRSQEAKLDEVLAVAGVVERLFGMVRARRVETACADPLRPRRSRDVP